MTSSHRNIARQMVSMHCPYRGSLQVSSWEIEEMIQIARRNGALGAKLTGGGGGGSIIALCPDKPGSGTVAQALEHAGYQAMEVTIE